jgi:broad specificity phosphatase PhoE
MKPLLIAVRHGETDYNARDCLQGHIDAPLNAKGRAHAAHMAAKLAEYDFTRIYASPLLRARQTAEIIADGRPITLDDRLKEVDFGAIDGMPIAEAKASGIYGERDRDRMAFTPPGGESYSQLLQRVQRFFNDTGIMKEAGPTLIVSHQGTTRMIAAHLGLCSATIAAYRGFGHESLLIAEVDATNRIAVRIED